MNWWLQKFLKFSILAKISLGAMVVLIQALESVWNLKGISQSVDGPNFSFEIVLS